MLAATAAPAKTKKRGRDHRIFFLATFKFTINSVFNRPQQNRQHKMMLLNPKFQLEEGVLLPTSLNYCQWKTPKFEKLHQLSVLMKEPIQKFLLYLGQTSDIHCQRLLDKFIQQIIKNVCKTIICV